MSSRLGGMLVTVVYGFIIGMFGATVFGTWVAYRIHPEHHTRRVLITVWVGVVLFVAAAVWLFVRLV